ncbi:hypothetical protein OHO28_09340 [Streptomyces europaeiscabiei]|uniref:hypothetical protein n=1 Tax=Streptomyces europaeiscabiei TaxID=146819 RepID=UPI002E178A03
MAERSDAWRDETGDTWRDSPVRLLTYAWWGVVVSTLDHETSLSGAGTEVRLATRQLLGGRSGTSRSVPLSGTPGLPGHSLSSC